MDTENKHIFNHNQSMSTAKNIFKWFIHIGLFLLTFFSTTIAGVLWLNKDPFDLYNFHFGLPYSVSIMFILTCHELGHYFAAKYHGIDRTLPYFIPFPPIPVLIQLFGIFFGTFGAVIKIKSVIPSRKTLFDIGAAGPICGFIASLIVLIYGFLNLPSTEFILAIHPDYDFTINASTYAHGIPLIFGDNILIMTLRNLLTDPTLQFVPPMSEIYHYPFLCAGWFGLLVTALNLMPLGQLDGGHIVYAMFTNSAKKIARITFFALIALGLPAIIDVLIRILLGFLLKRDIGQIIPFTEHTNTAWLFWALIAYFILKIYHPPVPDETPLDSKRIALGWICLFIFIVSISLNPISIG